MSNLQPREEDKKCGRTTEPEPARYSECTNPARYRVEVGEINKFRVEHICGVHLNSIKKWKKRMDKLNVEVHFKYEDRQGGRFPMSDEDKD